MDAREATEAIANAARVPERVGVDIQFDSVRITVIEPSLTGVGTAENIAEEMSDTMSGEHEAVATDLETIDIMDASFSE